MRNTKITSSVVRTITIVIAVAFNAFYLLESDNGMIRRGLLWQLLE